MLNFLKNGFRLIVRLFVKILKFLGLYKYKTATDILIDLGSVKYIEPDLATTMYYNEILSMLENQFEQCKVDYSMGMVSKKIYKARFKDLQKEFEKYRQEYLDILSVTP